MAAKLLVIFCIHTFLAHCAFSQCFGNGLNAAFGQGWSGKGYVSNGNGLAYNGIGLANNGIGLANNGIGLINNGFGLTNNGIELVNNGYGMNAALVNGGGFTVTSSSPIAPSGVSVMSDYVIEGPLTVGGQLPVLAAVDVEGILTTDGTAGTTYSCGNGNVGIISENGAANIAAGNAAVVNSAALAANGYSRCGNVLY